MKKGESTGERRGGSRIGKLQKPRVEINVLAQEFWVRERWTLKEVCCTQENTVISLAGYDSDIRRGRRHKCRNGLHFTPWL